MNQPPLDRADFLRTLRRCHTEEQLFSRLTFACLAQYDEAQRPELLDDVRGAAYSLRLLNLERQNLVAARENHEIAKERYLLGDLSGIEMREAQKSLLDAEERILSAEYDTKICEISLLQISGKITKYLE